MIERFQVGDWVLANYEPGGPPNMVKLRRIAAGPEFERDELGRARAELWMLDDGSSLDRRWLAKATLYEAVERARGIAERLRRFEIVDRKTLDAEAAHAHRLLAILEASYPHRASRPAEVTSAIATLGDLHETIGAWRRVPERLLCLATSIGWGAVLCAAGRRELEGARILLAARAAETRSPEHGDMFDHGWDQAYADAIGIIDNVLESKRESAREQDQESVGGADAAGPAAGARAEHRDN